MLVPRGGLCNSRCLKHLACPTLRDRAIELHSLIFMIVPPLLRQLGQREFDHGPARKMKYEELLSELIRRKAFVVHCSAAEQGDQAGHEQPPLLFPDDLSKAIHVVANERGELACSVVWPEHIKTFGSVGIVLKPRSVEFIISVKSGDAGSFRDPNTGKRIGMGLPFVRQTFANTFTDAKDYNEWSVTDADTVGIFVNTTDKLFVARRVALKEVPGYDPAMEMFGHDSAIVPVQISLSEIVRAFPKLPIFAFESKELVQIGHDGKPTGKLPHPYTPR